jgi:alpha-L-rhamnosidase
MQLAHFMTTFFPTSCRHSSSLRAVLVTITLVIPAFPRHLSTASLRAQPILLQTDALREPLGLDNPHPSLSWHLQDPRSGARQTAYEITVFSHRPAGAGAKPDVWDSGRTNSSVSTGVPYAGPDLRPEKRYFWRVTVWDQDNKVYPISNVSWFETGLLQQTNWHAEWIGFEPEELHGIRESGAAWITNIASTSSEPRDTNHDFRYRLSVDKAVKRAVLYTTGEDTAAAWINGQQVLWPKPLSPWKQMPWGTYERADVTSHVQQGENLLSIGITRYKIPREAKVSTQAPMSAVLFVLFTDGSTKLFTSAGEGWKAQLDAPEGWWQASYKDRNWKPAELYKPASDPFGSRDDGLPWPTGPVASLRKTFSPQAKGLVSARLYATALGAYKFHLNGTVVGDQVLSPGWMDFREHVAYQVYDVTSQIHRGPNAIAAFLAPGWYSTPLRWFRQGNNYGATQPALKAQLRLEYADGSVDWIATDSSWKADVSPILFAEIYDGETRDARREQVGWDTAGFKDDTWHSATVVAAKDPVILAQYFQPIREQRVMTAKKITEPKPGVYVYDFGQNMSAIPRLHVHGAVGDDIQLRFAEVLNPDGTLYVDNLRTAKATDHFILAGSKKGSAAFEDFQPLFTFHSFRYVEISGMKTRPTLASLKAVVLHTDAPFTARLSTGSSMVNQLWSNVLWGQRSNFVGVPTDCPQRDERLGWSADAQVFWRTATFNMDLSTFSRKYAADLHGTQVNTAMYGIFAPGIDSPNPGYGAAWSDAGVIVPWTGWIQSGNPRIIDENWEGMEKYLAEIESKNPDHLWRNSFGAAFGDWLTPTITTPEDLLATAYWAYDVTLMQQMARAPGRTAEAEHYEQLFTTIKTAFQQAYIRADGFVGTVDHFPSIPPPTVNPVNAQLSKTRPVETQTGYVLALYMHLMPDELRAAAADKLVGKIRDNHWLLGTGFVGTPYLLAVLSDTGHADVAYRILLNRAYPSWGYLIDHGATTTWERWNGDTMRDDPSMNSYNHYAYGAVAEWLYRYAAGVDTDPADPGFHTIVLHPNFDSRLGHLSFDYDSSYGTVHSDWSITGKTVHWKVIVPPNASAVLSTRSSNATEFNLNGASLSNAKSQLTPGKLDGDFLLPAGSYNFTATLQQPTASTEIVDAKH